MNEPLLTVYSPLLLVKPGKKTHLLGRSICRHVVPVAPYLARGGWRRQGRHRGALRRGRAVGAPKGAAGLWSSGG